MAFKRAIGAALIASALFAVLPAAPATASVWSARQIDGQPATFYWAVIVGATDYAGSTPNAPGSAEDAWSLRDHLLSLGWRSDHIYTVTNLGMTRDNILKAIRWMASKTNGRSLAIFHYSGHEKPTRTTADGDNETQDVQLWAADNRYIPDGELARELSRVRSYRSWFHISACRAAGFSDSGMFAGGRVVTWSSTQSELSWGDASLKASVFNHFMINQGMRKRLADANRDGNVTVEEAFWYSRRPVMDRTSNRQHPIMDDRWPGDFSLKPPVR